MGDPKEDFAKFGKGRPGLDWARKIRAAVLAGEKLPRISVEYAKEALGVSSNWKNPERSPEKRQRGEIPSNEETPENASNAENPEREPGCDDE